MTTNSKPRGTLAQHVVFATSLALVELTEIVRSIVLHGDIYAEEDFCANTYSVPIYSNREKESTISQLNYAMKLVADMDSTDSDEGQAMRAILGFLLDLLNVSSSVVRLLTYDVGVLSLPLELSHNVLHYRQE